MARLGLQEVRGGALKNGTRKGALKGSYAIIGSPVKGAVRLYDRVPFEGTMGFFAVPFKGYCRALKWGSLYRVCGVLY